MSFEPKIFEPSLFAPVKPAGDEVARDCEHDLPDDLLMLAEQLSDDADRLAGCYPASLPKFGSPLVGMAERAEVGAISLVVADVRLPANNAPNSTHPRFRSGRVAAAVLLLAGAGASVGVWLPTESPVAMAPDRPEVVRFVHDDAMQLSSAQPETGASDRSDGATTDAAPARVASTDAAEITQPEVIEIPPMAPSVFLDFSGPEQEAVIDLFESEHLDQSSISI